MRKWLRNIFKGKPEKVIEDRTGFFSTDIQLGDSTRGERESRAYAQTFQKTIDDFKIITMSMRTATDGKEEYVAMDASASNQNGLKVNQTNFGGSLPDGLLNWYGAQGFVGYQTAAMISQQWLVNKACIMPARDAARKGYETKINDKQKLDEKVLAAIAKGDKKYRVHQNLVDFVYFGRIFGIRVMMFKVDYSDPAAYAMPFNPDGIKPGSYRGMVQIDPYWITPELDAESAADPSSPHFYEPTWWRINGQRVHRTHLVVMRNGDVPDILKPTYIYGGIPVPQKILERVYAAERTANEAPMLALSKRLTVFKMDIQKAMANSKKFNERMAVWVALRDNYGIKAIDGKDEIQQFDTSLADLDAVIMTQYQLVAAASDTPATKLLGTTPKGFNSTGEYEEASYHELLESIQQDYMQPVVERHHICMIRSDIAPEFKTGPFETEIVWQPLDAPTAEELATVNLQKSQTDMAYVQMGAVTPEQVQHKLMNDKYAGYSSSLQEVDELPQPDPDDLENRSEHARAK